MAQLVKNPPAMQETWIWSVGQEDPLEKGMATHSNVLAWRILCTEEPGGLQSVGLQRVGHDGATNTSTFPIFTFRGTVFFMHFSCIFALSVSVIARGASGSI